MHVQGYNVLFYGDSITMRWRSDWPANQWGGPPPADTPGGTPMEVFNATFRVNYTSDVMGIGSERPTSSFGELPPSLIGRHAQGMHAGQIGNGCVVSSEALLG